MRRGRIVALLPPTPLLIPEATGHAQYPAQLRTGIDRARQWILPTDGPITIAFHPDDSMATRHVGSLKAWGIEVNVGAGTYLPDLVLRALLRRWGYDGEIVSVDVHDVQFLAEDGTLLDGPLLIAADGGAGLHPDAPLGDVPGAWALEEKLRRFVIDPAAQASAPLFDVAAAENCGIDPEPWIAWADFCRAHPSSVSTLYHWSSIDDRADTTAEQQVGPPAQDGPPAYGGIGFHCGVWQLTTVM
ncbi:hypothetical protein HMPREF1861_00405 [Corynebacterium kroppenstedtii]|nr:hypothetical protein HMPREF1861_00405 [Corynebacterium kroppenstedtii]